MKRCASIGRSVLLLLALALPPAAAQTELRYDFQGRNLGRAETRGGTTRFYDSQGRSTGRAEMRGRHLPVL